MNKSRVERLEKNSKQDEVGLMMVYQSPTLDYMEIEKLEFKGTVEDGNKIMKNKPGILFIIHQIPRNWFL